MSPRETLKPAKSIVASEGIGTQALSSSMSTKTPPSPAESTRFVAKSTSGLRTSPASAGARAGVIGRAGYTRADVPPRRPPERPCRPPPPLAVHRRRAAGSGGVRARLPAPLPRRRDPGPLRDDAGRIGRLRRPRQGARPRRPRPALGLVALLPPAGAVAPRARGGGGQRPARRLLRARQALQLRPAALRHRLRLHPLRRAHGRHAPARAHGVRAAEPRRPQAPPAQDPGRRGGIGRP